MRRLFPLLFLFAFGCASRMTHTIDEIFTDYSGDRPGAAVTVVRDGRVVFRKGYGLADLETKTAITPATNFRLASVTKQFTAKAIEILAERRTLSLDDPLSRWIPSLPPATKSITLHQVLHHTSGLVDYEDLIPGAQTEQISDADVLHLLESADRTVFEPGSRYQYSNSGYVLLGLVIERASGMTLGEFLQHEIFAKDGMQHSVLMDRGAAIPTRAYGHERDHEQWTRHDQSVTSATRGDGAIYSSIDDMAKWAASLGTNIPNDTVATDEANARYGHGWFVSDDFVWHTGSTMGFRNAILRDPKKRLAVIVLTNRNEGEPIELAKRVAAKLY